MILNGKIETLELSLGDRVNLKFPDGRVLQVTLTTAKKVVLRLEHGKTGKIGRPRVWGDMPDPRRMTRDKWIELGMETKGRSRGAVRSAYNRELQAAREGRR